MPILEWVKMPSEAIRSLIDTPMMPSQPNDLKNHWSALDGWLHQQRALWQPIPFSERRPGWCADHPGMAEALLALTDDQLEVFTADSAALNGWLTGWLPALAQREALLALPDLSGVCPALPGRLSVDMPGRKWAQAQAFAGASMPLRAPLLDWCCGKGHLARVLSQAGGVAARGLEWDAQLVAQGHRLSQRADLPVVLQLQDVMAADVDIPLAETAHALALHACGDLHLQLLRRASAAGVARITLSPCCYHRIEADTYRSLSQACLGSRLLPMSRDSLRLVVQETVTAPRHDQRRREQGRRWRLGFDLLQRELRADDGYLPLPSHPPALLQQDFAAFCRWAADLRGLALPSGLDWVLWEQRGEQRLAEVKRLECLRHLFRRPLEVWLVLDLALFLQEQGYHVRLGTFCARELTPRNLLLDARRLVDTLDTPPPPLVADIRNAG